MSSVQPLHAFLHSSGKILAEYVWLDGISPKDLRSKTKVLQKKPESIADIPVISVDVFPTSLAKFGATEVFLKPRKLFRDPFRGGDHLLVLCDTFQSSQVDPATFRSNAESAVQPHALNNRAPCQVVMEQARSIQPLFAFDQEFSVHSLEGFDPSTSPLWSSSPDSPLLYPSSQSLRSRGPSHQAASPAGFARAFAEEHMSACLCAGLSIAGIEQGCCPSAWSFRLGPLPGLDISDELWVSRFLALRLAEIRQVAVSFDPNAAVPGRAGGGGCSVEYSTAETRQPGTGIASIVDHLHRLQATHLTFLLACGKGSQYDSQPAFTYSVGDRSASIVIPTATAVARGGSYIDQRPAANMDPYLVTLVLVSTTLGLPLMPVAIPGTMPGTVVGSPSSSAPTETGMALNGLRAFQSLCATLMSAAAAPSPLISATPPGLAAAGGSFPPGLQGSRGMPVPPPQRQQQQQWLYPDTDEAASLSQNTEDMLIEELDRLDGAGCSTGGGDPLSGSTPGGSNKVAVGYHCATFQFGDSLEEGFGECSACASPNPRDPRNGENAVQ